jgi:glycosyltransferase involved in cell wall biosynthesis
MYGEGDAVAAAQFADILDRTNPDIVHFHALTSGASLLAMREAKRRGKRLLLTYHTPTVSCARGTMMRWGREACDGKIDARRCVACTLNQKGVYTSVAQAIASVQIDISKLTKNRVIPRKYRAAVRMPELIRVSNGVTLDSFAIADRIVAVCEWVKQVLLVNGVDERRVHLCRQGLAQAVGTVKAERDIATLPAMFSTERPLRLAYFGRLDVTKGVHTVLQAIVGDPALAVSFDLYGVNQGEAGVEYRTRLEKIAATDRRIHFSDAVASSEIVSTMARYDLVVVPSEWLETGPLVVYEAFAARVPVIGSDLGGIAELVEDGKTGRLVSPSNANVWHEALISILRDPNVIDQWRSQIPVPRTMADVAQEMSTIYRAVLVELE